uniref:Exonuclease 1 n=1 Tax=Salvator merianae TaxID=96440 RepID=A0A8D0DPL7_SALMN
MGIHGLLQFIKDAAEPSHVKKYKGQAVAVDTYCWLHKGAYACAEKLARGEPTDQYVTYCMKLVDMLLSFGVKPVLVFDGCTLPSKKDVEKSRREKRQANLMKGKQLLREGKASEARECFARSINITHAMACEVIKVARAQGIDCIVAPYEADAQLAYLNKTGIVQAVITEDSDLLAFGCKKVFLKIDKFGNGLEIDQSRLGMCKQLGDVFTEEKFRYMCILSGCDYLPSLHGIGLGKACKLLKVANNPDITKVIGKMGQYLKMNISVPEDYIQGFIRANNTFLYQLVFDPIRRKLVPLNAYQDDIDPETLFYAGKHIGDNTAFQIALGNKDISTMEQIDNYNPEASQHVRVRSRGWNDKGVSETPSHLKSIWSRDYTPGFTTKVAPNPAALLEKPTTRGTECLIDVKGLKLPGKALSIKRPRHDLENLSESDLLSQYSISNANKKLKPETNDEAPAISPSEDSCRNDESLNFQPRLRNKFALILQKKNEESGAVVVPGTKSRFFCNTNISPGSEKNCQTLETGCGVKKDSSPPLSETGEMRRTVSISSGTPQTTCFGWSKSFVKGPTTFSPSQSVPPLKQPDQNIPTDVLHQDCEVSRTQASSSSASEDSEEGEKESPSKELERSSNKPINQEVSGKPPITEKKDDKVPGLPKTTSIKSHGAMTCKSLIPAKVSGLSKRNRSADKKNHHNAENKSQLQVTINELWTAFQFKRDSERLPSSRKSKPLSPIKDNNIQLTPDADEDTFNKLEYSHVQRKIFQ